MVFELQDNPVNPDLSRCRRIQEELTFSPVALLMSFANSVDVFFLFLKERVFKYLLSSLVSLGGLPLFFLSSREPVSLNFLMISVTAVLNILFWTKFGAANNLLCEAHNFLSLLKIFYPFN